MEETQKIFKLAVSVGETLLGAGGEIYRVQETIERILDAYGAGDYHVFVISNGIFATMHEEGLDRGSMVRHVPLGSVNLEKIAVLNQLSREICDHECDLEEAYERLEKCKALPSVSRIRRILAGGLGSAAFGVFFGCKILDCLIAFVLGVLLQWFVDRSARAGVSKFVTNIIGSAVATAISYGLIALGVDFNQNAVIIGTIFLLVPGVALTTSFRELLNKDYLSGTIHLVDALLTAISIAVGVGAAVLGYQLLGGVIR